MNRRVFLVTAAAGMASAQRPEQAPAGPVPEVIRSLKPMTAGIQPITADERRARIEKARRLMREHQISAVVAESGSTLYYFTGTRQIGAGAWILPVSGEPVWVVPPNLPAPVAGDVRPFTDPETQF